jgi:predicted nucleotidyltransferase
MPIPESQLETWSHQGAVATASATYKSIQTALAANSSPIKGRDYEVYLQGSYKNDTNIRGDSDVDVVVQLNSSWGRDLSNLSEYEKRLYQAAFENATYLWHHFRTDVLTALRKYYGDGAIKEGNKSLKLSAGPGRIAADIVPALHYRKYERFYGTEDYRYIHGMKFYCRDGGRAVVNYPRSHHANGVTKHSASGTNEWYKPTVRMFKNARTYMVDRGLLPEDLAPSYFLECLLYNVPDGKFGASFEDTFVEAYNWLWGEAPTDRLICQNGQLLLFGGAPEQWDKLSGRRFLEALKSLWESW